MKKFGFTLAEIMIVFTIIGVLAMILLPIANHSRPDEAVMKFKKADTTLKNVIRELVTSDKYYLNGDLGTRANGQQVTGCNNGDYKFFCKSFADLISAKKENCSEVGEKTEGKAILNVEENVYQSYLTAKITADNVCKSSSKKVGEEITAADGIVYYQTAPIFTFGVKYDWSASYSDPCRDGEWRLFSSPDKVFHVDSNGFDRIYKIFCIDVDGIPTEGSANCDDVKDICPFGYGIRADGKIFSGKRADEWMEKGFQKGSNEN